LSLKGPEPGGFIRRGGHFEEVLGSSSQNLGFHERIKADLERCHLKQQGSGSEYKGTPRSVTGFQP